MLFSKGLPPLGNHQFSSTKSEYRTSSTLHSFIFEEREFGVLEPLRLHTLPRLISAVWTRYFKRGALFWSSESLLCKFFSEALEDCIELANLSRDLVLHKEVFLQTGGLLTNRADIAIVNTQRNTFVGVIEVKKPDDKLSEAENHNVQLNQVFDYMYDMRYVYGMRFVFGIITSYKYTRILWLEDTDAAAKETDLDTFNQLCRAFTPEEFGIPDNVKLFGTKWLQYDDPLLVECLVTLMFKMHQSPTTLRKSFISRTRKFPYLAAKLELKKLPDQLKELTYKLAPANTRNFYILAHYHRGGDGRVALCCSSKGNLGVLKYLMDKNDNVDNNMERLTAEVNAWKQIWGVKGARVVKSTDKWAIMMPFAFHLRHNEQGEHVFAPVNIWNRIAEWKPSKEIREDALFDESLQHWLKAPEEAAKSAIRHMTEKGFQHDDLEWRHVALLPEESDLAGVWRVRPILIDLTRISRINSEDAETVYMNQVNSLLSKSR
jgi:hypothetical protein